jgi:hypothetical protein
MRGMGAAARSALASQPSSLWNADLTPTFPGSNDFAPLAPQHSRVFTNTSYQAKALQPKANKLMRQTP